MHVHIVFSGKILSKAARVSDPDAADMPVRTHMAMPAKSGLAIFGEFARAHALLHMRVLPMS